MVEIVNIYIYVTDFSSPRQVRLPHSPHNQIEAERRGKWQKLLLRINGEWNLTDSKNQDLKRHFDLAFWSSFYCGIFFNVCYFINKKLYRKGRANKTYYRSSNSSVDLFSLLFLLVFFLLLRRGEERSGRADILVLRRLTNGQRVVGFKHVLIVNHAIIYEVEIAGAQVVKDIFAITLDLSWDSLLLDPFGKPENS